MTRSRRSEAVREFDHERLRSEHSRLDNEIARLEAQLHLSPEEESALKRMKKEKLLAKDRLNGLGSG